MRPQKQAFKHDPKNGVFGDCYRTSIAALLDLDRDQVPHFMDGCDTADDCKQKRTYQDVDDWFRARGLTRIVVIFNADLVDVLNSIKHCNPGLAFLLTGQSSNGTNHVVVCRDGQIVCDPALDDSGIIGPCDDGYFWVEFIGVALARDVSKQEAA